jgi:mono/diheme cytochrome c family protein
MSTRPFVKIAGAVVAAGFVLLLLLVWYGTRTPTSTLGDASNSADAALVERGEYVARTSDCVACHSVPDQPAFAGGLKMATPLGGIYATNITPDATAGIGGYSLADFDRAVRHGVAPQGRRLYPAMPYPSYSKLSDDDVRALYAFFMHGVRPVAQPNIPSDIPWPLNMRWPIALWNALFTEPAPFQEQAGKNVQWNRGAYLVQGPGHCGSCHTPRGLAFNEKALTDAGEAYLAGALLDGWYAPSLRNDPNTGLGRWSEADIAQFLRAGRNPHAVVFGSMTEAFNNSTQFLSDEDLAAIAHYLKSLPGDPKRDGQPWQYQSAEASVFTTPGGHLYLTQCASCHGQDGKGQAPWIPPLSGATSAMVSAPDSAINISLNGSLRVVTAGVPDAYRMPALRGQLSDQEIADVLSFVRTTWGNQGGKVEAQAVTKLRAHTDPASPTPIILHMR